MFDWLGEGIAQFFLGIAQALFNLFASLMSEVASSSTVSGAFDSLFSGSEVWNMVTTVHQTLVIPIAESILALLMLVQLVKISQRIDATATLPAVKDIVFLAVFYVLFHWLIVNSLDIVTAIYDIFNGITTSILPSSSAYMSAVDLSSVETSWDTIGGCALLALFGLISVAIGAVAYLVALVVSMARSLQLYVMAAFSPLPLSLLGFEETRQMGIGFLKNFSAVALAGAIMMFTMFAYPFLLASVSGVDSGGLAAVANGTNDGIFSLLSVLAISLMYIFALAKSGAWAREILGS